MKKILNVRHQIGLLCHVASFRDIIEYKTGQAFSTDFCFGLGSGLGFELIQKFNGFLPIIGFNVYTTDDLCRNLGIMVQNIMVENSEECIQKICGIIDEGDPLIVYVDRNEYQESLGNTFFAKQLPQFIGAKNSVQMNFNMMHVIMICGYDLENEEFYFSEQEFSSIKTIKKDLLIKSLNPSVADQNEMSQYLVKKKYIQRLKFPDQLFPIQYAIQRAIKHNAWQMLYPKNPGPGFIKGLAGLKYFFDHLIDILEKIRKRELIISQILLKNTCVSRNSYCQFLNEAKEIIPSDELNQASLLCSDLYRKWKEFNNYFIKIANNTEKIETRFISVMTEQIFQQENELNKILLENFF